MSLYGRLFKYRERQARSPLEDFTSEALADILMRMPMKERVTLAGTLFVPPADRSQWIESASHGDIQIVTQRRLGTEGIADIVLEKDHSPLLLVENKVGAAIRHNGDESQIDR